MKNVNDYVSNENLERLAIFLSQITSFKAYDIKQTIIQLNSIDNALSAIYEANIRNLSLDEVVYLALKGKDERCE